MRRISPKLHSLRTPTLHAYTAMPIAKPTSTDEHQARNTPVTEVKTPNGDITSRKAPQVTISRTRT